MSLYYCLADTVVNGEIVIQGSSVTYSASSSAFDSSNTSFEDAAKVATVNSNTAAIIAARNTIDGILISYTYVLSDENITSMINNSLKTTITRITPRYLNRIANTDDGINYILKKNTIIAENQYLLIPAGKTFTVPETFDFTNYGIIQIGSNNRTSNNRTKTAESIVEPASTAKITSPPSCTADTTMTVTLNKTGTNYNTINIGTGDNQNGACLIVKTGVTITGYLTYNNYGTINNNVGGNISFQSVICKNAQLSTPPGYSGAINNNSASATFYASS